MTSNWVNRIVVPGDAVPEISDVDSDDRAVVLGPGLVRDAEGEVRVAKAGLLKSKRPEAGATASAFFWVDTHSRRYVPARGENVIGVVVGKHGPDAFRVDIGASEPASLSFLAFEGATKKNRPNVQVGDIVYAKLLVASKDMEPELVCVDSYGKKAGLGVLSGAASFVFSVPLHIIRKLLSPDCVLLATLGKTISFEIAVGMNGRVWIRGRSIKDSICLANAVNAAEFMNNDEIKRMVNKLVEAMQGF